MHIVPDALHWPEGCRFADRCPVRMDACRHRHPPLFALSPGHQARCLFYETPAAGASPSRAPSARAQG